MKTLQKQDDSVRQSRAQANQPSVQRVGRPAKYGPISPPAQLKDGALQRVWYERIDGKINEKPDPRPKDSHKPFNQTPYVGKDGKQTTVTVWEPKIKATPQLSYHQKLGPVPTTGEFTISSKLVRFSQDSIAKTFSTGGSIDTTITNLKNGTLKSSSLPAIRVIWSKQDSVHEEARLVTLDNRRLYCCQQAGVDVKCVLVDWDNLPKKQKDKEIEKFTSGGGRAGKATIGVRG